MQTIQHKRRKSENKFTLIVRVVFTGAPFARQRIRPMPTGTKRPLTSPNLGKLKDWPQQGCLVPSRSEKDEITFWSIG